MDEKRFVKISKYLAKHLRHQPERLGLTLAEGGWVSVDALLAACNRHGFALTRAELDEVVRDNDKQRYAFNSTGTLIRANQGHTVEVDLQLDPLTPPVLLYHGTASHTLDAIRRDGILRMERNHVHLSPDIPTAIRVGSRHGTPVILFVNAQRMHADGHVFYCSTNGVWLTECVPPGYIVLVTDAHGVPLTDAHEQ